MYHINLEFYINYKDKFSSIDLASKILYCTTYIFFLNINPTIMKTLGNRKSMLFYFYLENGMTFYGVYPKKGR